ncbi:MAG TPA: hypothetical protein VJI68_01690 [Candidatus Nanoarchaeia archaeon]|nr:hypothetical protein [Candidatus Nanoarchaeia archaeon]
MNFIKSIIDGKANDEAHRQFKRFSKGEFNNRAVVDITIQSSAVKIKTTFEYAHDFIRHLVETIKDTTNVTGGIITISKELQNYSGIKIESMKQFAGVRTYNINAELSKENILKAMKDFPDALFCLSFSTEEGSLKTKVKSPKAAKPGKDDEGVKADYCVFTTKNKNIIKEFAFDVKEDFKKFRADHDFFITELVVPDQYKNDFAMARIHAKRKGKIIRKLNVDGKESSKEFDFEA